MTSAPRSPSCMVQNGPPMTWVRSTTRMPASARFMGAILASGWIGGKTARCHPERQPCHPERQRGIWFAVLVADYEPRRLDPSLPLGMTRGAARMTGGAGRDGEVFVRTVLV